MAPSKNTYSPCFLKFSQFPLTLALAQDAPETLSCTHTTPTAPHPCEPEGSMG